MSSPKLICKSGYIKDLAHVLNTLEYAGNKIAAQHIVFKDGSTAEVDSETRIVLTDAQLADIVGIHLDYKDGGGSTIDYEAYRKFTRESRESIRVHELREVQDDAKLLVNSDGKRYHRMEDLDFYAYLPYIAEREGAEQEAGHGLFGLDGNIDIEDAKAMATEYADSIKWSHILSMDAQAAIDAGFDRRTAWKNLVVAKAPEIAADYNIRLENLVLNAAYHGNTDNPHVHLVLYSKNKREGYIKGGKAGMLHASEKLKLQFFNEIFKDDAGLLEIKKEKSQQREEIRKQLDKRLQSCLAKDYGQTELTKNLQKLADTLPQNGSRKYGFLPAEVKTQVDGILRWVMEQDSDMAAMLDQYCELQKGLISNYVVNPATLEEKLEKFKNDFFHPDKKQLRLYHNAIVDCADQLRRLTPTPPHEPEDWVEELEPEPVRTAGEEIFDNIPSDGDLSSVDFALPHEPEEIPFPSDEDAPPEFERTPEGEIFDDMPSDDDLSSVDFTAPHKPLGEDAPPQDAPDPSPERTAEEKITEDTPAAGKLSTPKAEMDKIMKNKRKEYSRVYRKALADIFNPKLVRTGLQEHAMEHFTALRAELAADPKARYTPQSKAHIRELFSLLYSTDGEFRENMDALLEQAESQLCKKFPPDEVKRYMKRFQGNLHSADFITPAHDDLFYFAETLDDQKYYQLLSAYQEFNKPLNKSIYHALDALCSGKDREKVLPELRRLGYLAENLDDDDVNEAARDIVRGLFSQLREDETVAANLQDFFANYGVVLDDNFDNAKAKAYKERLSKTLSGVLRLMRPHFAVVRFAENLDEYLYNQATRDKEINKPMYKVLFKALGDALSDNRTDDSAFLAQLLRQELHQLHDTGDQQHGVNILKILCDTDQSVRFALDDVQARVYNRLKADLGSAAAGEWMAKYREELFSAESKLPLHFALNGYAKNLSENYFRQVVQSNREQFSIVNQILSARMRGSWEAMGGGAANELHRLLREKEPDHVAIEAATAKLFRQLCDPTVERELEHCMARLMDELKKTCTDPNMLLELEERLRTAVYLGEDGVPTNFILQSFSKNLEKEHIKFVIKELKPQFKEFRSQLYRHLCGALASGNPAAARILKAYSRDASGAAQMQELLQALSCKAYNFMAEKEKLYEAVFTQLQKRGVQLPESEYREVLENLFYRKGDSDYDTLFMRELVEGVLDNQSEIIRHQHDMLCGQFAKSLFHTLARMLNSQAQNANRTQPVKAPAFKAKQQFRNRRQFRAQGFEQEDSFSY